MSLSSPTLGTHRPTQQRARWYLSDAEVGIADFAQVRLGAQKGGQLGLGEQVLQVVGSPQHELRQGQAHGPAEMTHS